MWRLPFSLMQLISSCTLHIEHISNPVVDLNITPGTSFFFFFFVKSCSKSQWLCISLHFVSIKILLSEILNPAFWDPNPIVVFLKFTVHGHYHPSWLTTIWKGKNNLIDQILNQSRCLSENNHKYLKLHKSHKLKWHIIENQPMHHWT